MKSRENAKKARLVQAMKQNITRRKESVSDVDLLRSKIDKITTEKPRKILTQNNYKEVLNAMVELFSGAVAGSLLGYGFAWLCGLKISTTVIFFMAFGFMGGFYNIYKKQ